MSLWLDYYAAEREYVDLREAFFRATALKSHPEYLVALDRIAQFVARHPWWSGGDKAVLQAVAALQRCEAIGKEEENGRWVSASTLIDAVKPEEIEQLAGQFLGQPTEIALRRFAESARAHHGYRRRSYPGIELGRIAPLAQEFHQSLNSVRDDPEHAVDCYIRLFELRRAIRQGDASAPGFLAELCAIDTTIIGAFGSMAIIRQQFPWSDESRRRQMLDRVRRIDPEASTVEMTLSALALGLLLREFRRISLPMCLADLRREWATRLHPESLLTSHLEVNLKILNQEPPESFVGIMDRFERAGTAFRDSLAITAMNALNAGLHRPARPEDDGVRQRCMQTLALIPQGSFYHDGARLIVSTRAMMAGLPDAAEALAQLAEQSTNFMVHLTASLNLMSDAARRKDDRAFGIAAQRYARNCEEKGIAPVTLDPDKAATLLPLGGEWHFVSLHTRPVYFRRWRSPWGLPVI